jgi:hypothetical protein
MLEKSEHRTGDTTLNRYVGKQKLFRTAIDLPDSQGNSCPMERSFAGTGDILYLPQHCLRLYQAVASTRALDFGDLH